MFVAEDTIVHTLRGPRQVGQLAIAVETVWCFTWAQGRISIGRCSFEHVGEQELHRVVLDNGKSLLMSADSVLLRRDGQEQPVIALAGKSVMPLYLSELSNGYPSYRQLYEHRASAPAPADRKPWRSVARMVWEYRSGCRLLPGFLVRHLDGDRTNCCPDNLRLEGRPQRRPRRNTVRRHIEAQNMTLPKNHKLLGFTPWGQEPSVRAVPVDCASVAMGEIFMVTHGT